MIRRTCSAQQGLVTVEFALIGLLFLTLVFGIIETARSMFVMNTIDEATRRGARVAAVCPMHHADIARITIFGEPGGDDASPVLMGLNTGHVSVEYLAKDGTAAISYPDIAFVRVSVRNYNYPLLFPLGSFDVPPFTTTLPAESLGWHPDLHLRTCIGI